MPRFRYIAYDLNGKREEGRLEAASRDQAWARLVGLDLTVTDLEPDEERRKSAARLFDIGRSSPPADQADLAEQLAVLFGAKLPVLEVLRIAEATTPKQDLRRFLLRTRKLMEEGQSLPDAIATSGSGLSPLFISIARVGQASGQLPQMMAAFASSLRRQEKLSAQVGGALVYPLILIVGGLIVFLMMTLFLAPRLETIFTSANKTVPAELAFFIGLGRFLQAWGGILAVAFGSATIAGLIIAQKRRRETLRVLARMPLIGSVLRQVSLARLTASLGLLLRAGMPLTSAVRETANAFSGQLFAETFDAAASAIEDGRKGADVFSTEASLPPLFRELYSVGETSNTLPEILATLTVNLEETAERQIQRLLALLTPMLTLIIGGAIAALVYSVMGALLSVNDLAF